MITNNGITINVVVHNAVTCKVYVQSGHIETPEPEQEHI
jgi:hypothetical protein